MPISSCPRILVPVLISSLMFACVQSNGGEGSGGSAGGSKAAGRAGSGGSGNQGGKGGNGGSGGTGGDGAEAGSGGSSASPDGGTEGDTAAASDASAGDAAPAAGGDCTAANPNSLFCKPLQTMPMKIKDTGLFPSAPDFTKLAPSLKHYVPDPPLWSDGMGKERFMLLPAGKQIDNTNPGQWIFPVGTIFIKTFFDDSGAGGKPRPIETRFIRRVGTENDFVEYDYYLYQWNAQGTDADLVINDKNGDDQYAPTVKITINRMENGKPLMVNGGMPFDHTLPARHMCGDCHGGNGLVAQTFIGFDEVRLNSKLTSTSTKTQLDDFQASGIFMKTQTAPPRTVTSPDPLLQPVLRFVFGNCVHCHNAKGMEFDMAPEVFVKNTVGQMTMAQSVQPPPTWLRVYPGDPEKSVVFVQARRMPLPMPTTVGGDRLRPMPPFGVNDMAADQDGVAALKAWILSLKK